MVCVLDDLNIQWEKTVSLATDGAPTMVGRQAGVAKLLKDKLTALNTTNKFCNFHCLLHQEALCSKTLKMGNVMDIVLKTVNFIRSRSLNHRQFNNSLLEECENPFGIPCHTDVRC